MKVGDRVDIHVEGWLAEKNGIGPLFGGVIIAQTDKAVRVDGSTILRRPPGDGDAIPCRLCARPLREEASKSIGYGPDCAVQLGLTNKFIRDLRRALTRDEVQAAEKSIRRVLWLPLSKIRIVPHGMSVLDEQKLQKQREAVKKVAPLIPTATELPDLAAAAMRESDQPIPTIILPPGQSPRGYQWRDVRFHLDRRNSYNGSEPGTGKTWIGGLFMMEALRRLQEEGRDGPGLILAPPVMILGWVQWFKDCWPQARVQPLKGYTAKVDPKADIYIIPYSSLAKGWEPVLDQFGRQVIEKRTQKDGSIKLIPVFNRDRVVLSDTARAIMDQSPRVAVCDEFHYAKSFENQRTQATVQMLAPTEYLLGMSGTMIMNRPQEAVPQFDALGYLDSLFEGREAFETQFCGKHLKTMTVTGKLGNKIKRKVWDFKAPEGSVLVELHHRMQAFYIRHKKVDVAPELPPLDLARVPVELSNRSAYNLLEQQTAELPPMQRLGMLGKLRQLCGMGKIDAAIEWIENFLECDEKLVVFAHHQAVQQALLEHFTKQWKGREPLHILSTDSMKARQAAINAFQTDPGQLLIVCSLGAAREGVTLTAASNMLMIELDWVPGVLTQAWNRIHRIGAEADRVTVWTLMAPGSIDETMNEKLVTKRIVTGEVLDGEAEVIDEREVKASALRELMVRVARRKKGKAA